MTVERTSPHGPGWGRGLLGPVALVLAVALGGCGGHRTAHRAQPPVPIVPGDVCAVCGMYITHYPGPRGEAYLEGRKGPLKFGSTRDFFAYILQPEHRALLETLYVQDMAATNWRHPHDHWIDARKAWYVPETARPAAMGPTLASFLHRRDAEAFVRRYGGRVRSFSQVTIELITDLSFDRTPGGRGAASNAPASGSGNGADHGPDPDRGSARGP